MTTAGKVANTATTANTATSNNIIVARDASGNIFTNSYLSTASINSGGVIYYSLNTTNNALRFGLGFNGVESGSNTESNFYIWRFRDVGGFLGKVFSANRSTGLVTIPNFATTDF